MKFKLIFLSRLFPTDTKYISQSRLDLAHPEEFCFDRIMIENYFNDIIQKINVNDLLDQWTLRITIYLGTSLYDKGIGIPKRGSLYQNQRVKEVYIYISLPSDGEISWGYRKKRFIETFYKIMDSKYNKTIPVDYDNYRNIAEYIEDSIKIGLTAMFKNGITLKKHKIEL